MTDSHACRRRRRVAVLAALAALAAGCGSSHSASGPTSGSSKSTASGAGIAAARAALAPYEGHPSDFPATQTLAKRPAPGTRFIYLQCETPICALIGQLLLPATKALGVTLSVINSGATATTSQAAAAAALAQKPGAVLLPAVDPQLFGNTLHKLVSAGIPVTGVGVIDGAPYGVEVSAGGTASVAHAGQLMADWAVAHGGGKASVVFFGSPELSFSVPMHAAFKAELAKVCPGCKEDYQQIPVETFGSTAPAAVVSYLQAHPGTNTAVFATMEAATGLAAALKDAHMHLTTLGFAPSPSNLQDIKNGGLTAGLGLDLSVQQWIQVDITARLLAHQAVSPAELNVDLQFLTQRDVTTEDTLRGWTGYPDVAQRFAKLWRS